MTLLHGMGFMPLLPIRLHGAVGNEALRLPDLFRLLSEIVVNICLFLAQQPPSGSGPPHSRGF